MEADLGTSQSFQSSSLGRSTPPVYGYEVLEYEVHTAEHVARENNYVADSCVAGFRVLHCSVVPGLLFHCVG